MADFAKQFGSYVYPIDTDFEELSEEGGVSNPVTIPLRSDIAVERDGNEEPIQFSIRGLIAVSGGGTYDQFQALIDGWKTAHRKGFREFRLDNGRYIRAQVVQRSLQYLNAWSASYSVRFQTATAYWTPDSETIESFEDPTTEDTLTIFNPGATNRSPAISILFGSADTLTLDLTNESNEDDLISINSLAVSGGQVLVIDTDAGTVELDGDDVSANVVGGMGNVTSWVLVPGDNNIVIEFTEPTISEVNITFTPQYL
jgi:hypothetical protein